MPATQLIEVRRQLPPLLSRLWRFAMVQCRNADIAQDLVQAACVRAMERADQFVPGTRFDRWVFSILASIWHNEIEKQKVRTGHGIVEADTIASSEFIETIEMNTTVKQIVALIAALPDQQRTVALLVYVEGFTFQEASQALGVPIGTLLSRMAAVRAALAGRIAPEYRGQSAKAVRQRT
jgi:RNA polymerase sigma-70 factor, ECF subfamily